MSSPLSTRMKHDSLPSKLKTPPQSLKRFSVSLRLQSRADCYLSLKCNHISKTHGSWMYSLISFDKCVHLCNYHLNKDSRNFPQVHVFSPTSPLRSNHYSGFYPHRWEWTIVGLYQNRILQYVFPVGGFFHGVHCFWVSPTLCTRSLLYFIAVQKSSWNGQLMYIRLFSYHYKYLLNGKNFMF